jgi:hypothetical protein
MVTPLAGPGVRPIDVRSRSGAAFDVGETFSGVDLEQGLKAARKFGQLTSKGMTTAQAAIDWVGDPRRTELGTGPL